MAVRLTKIQYHYIKVQVDNRDQVSLIHQLRKLQQNRQIPMHVTHLT